MAVGAAGDAYDNRELIRRLANLRLELAQLLGSKSFAEKVLARRMAGSTTAVYGLLDELLEAYKPLAEKELAAVADFAREAGATLPSSPGTGATGQSAISRPSTSWMKRSYAPTSSYRASRMPSSHWQHASTASASPSARIYPSTTATYTPTRCTMLMEAILAFSTPTSSLVRASRAVPG